MFLQNLAVFSKKTFSVVPKRLTGSNCSTTQKATLHWLSYDYGYDLLSELLFESFQCSLYSVEEMLLALNATETVLRQRGAPHEAAFVGMQTIDILGDSRQFHVLLSGSVSGL